MMRNSKMLIDCIGCLHGSYPNFTDPADLLIVTGDLTAHDKAYEYLKFFMWISKTPHRKRIVIAGNHDNLAQEECSLLRVPKGDFEYLEDEGTEFEGLRIWGSPWTSTFDGINRKCKAFTYDSEEFLIDKWEKKMPSDLDILITHGPAHGELDEVLHRQTNLPFKTGSKYLHGLFKYYFRPKLHVFSHIHEGYGQKEIFHTMKSVNCSHMNENYNPLNKPIRIEL